MNSDIIGGFPKVDPNCAGCGKPLELKNAWMTDGCPCNTALGVNSMNETRWRLLMQLQQLQSRALEPFANLIPGGLDTVGGGTLAAPEIKIQWIKDARAALGRQA